MSYPLILSHLHKSRPELLEDSCSLWLNPSEQELLDEITAPRKKRSYLLGRYAAKLGLSRYLQDSDLLCCSVERGALGQPVVKSTLLDVPEVSLSHSGNHGACIVFPAGQQFALDLEEIKPKGNRSAAIEKHLTEKEKELYTRLKEEVGEVELLYLIWTVKEALSKVLRCGLTLPFEALGLDSLEWKEGILHSRFTHFTQYRGIGEWKENMALSLVFPWKSKIIVNQDQVL